MQLPRLGQLPLAPDRRVDAAEVRQRRRVGEAVEHLGHARLGPLGPLGAPVASGQRVLEALGDGAGLDGEGEVDLLCVCGLLCCVGM